MTRAHSLRSIVVCLGSLLIILGCRHNPTPTTQPVADHKPSYEDFVSTHTFPYIASPERQAHLRQNYSRLSVGLVKDQVLEILGEPDYSSQEWSKQMPRQYIGSNWTYFFEKPDYNLTNLEKDKSIEVYFDASDGAHWIVSNVEGLKEMGSPQRRDSRPPSSSVHSPVAGSP